MENYTITGRIGEGAHGLVLKAYHNTKGHEVALKKVLLKRIDDGIPTSIIREVKTLQQLKHPYIAELLDAFPTGIDFVMVFEYMPSGLWEMLKDNERSLTALQVKCYTKMLLEGVAYMHANKIMHRDLKPANLLVNSEGILKIADFGLGRLMWEDNTHPYSHQVATRWYRAPELLYGARFYTSAIDMWSVGCIFGEMLNNSPLFPGETDIEQLAIVLRHLGSPTPESWPELSTLPDYNKITFPYHKGLLWEQIVPDAHQEAINLVKQLLVYNSAKRLPAREALHHAYFHCMPFAAKNSPLPKPPQDHRIQLKPKEIDANVKLTTLFKDLLNCTYT
ncbi:cyclin-dependent kinase 20 [Orussus abietinus]|uniref:cyclin-dependent kinase 20 n=1 Tax=Orussus abietinus TaxID=222816 RepID=UPI0006261A64|nr:cyclin-dependent kinase 20 [Orussus abietinus]XP_012277523.1 cyclin-dependent kinase 20 [Orussus abietinus]XP_012277524.1 cyclin-dependent kinase 20 [Orussus abietinus]XP_012277525.1 cyclin-dependent kinase 20 [Orussus abietinus]XP_012277526.1 cyclin-dependent kinase 20 [Orussus abietinus]XP_012277528.1 cyclin-dependent kinase 20 [Orussus abietinus]